MLIVVLVVQNYYFLRFAIQFVLSKVERAVFACGSPMAFVVIITKTMLATRIVAVVRIIVVIIVKRFRGLVVLFVVDVNVNVELGLVKR